MPNFTRTTYRAIVTTAEGSRIHFQRDWRFDLMSSEARECANRNAGATIQYFVRESNERRFKPFSAETTEEQKL